MTLECTLVRGPSAAWSSSPEELTIAAHHGMSGSELQTLLQEARGVGELSVAGHDLSSLTVGHPPLVTGAVLVDGPPQPGNAAAPPPPLMLLAHTGPGAGSVFPIQRGDYSIGRGAVDICVPDPAMSREHAVLKVSSTALRVADTGSRNSVFIDGEPVRQGVVTSSSTLRCGNTAFTIVTPNGSPPGIPADAGSSVEEPIEVQRPTGSSNRWSMVLGAGLPLVLGIGLALATGMWMFLGFTAVSAVSILVPMIVGRKGRKEFKRAVARAAQEDAERRRRSSPSAADIAMATFTPAASSGLSPSRPDATATQRAEPAAATLHIPAPCSGIWVRLGSRPAPANIRLAPPDPHFCPPSIGSTPVALDPRPSIAAFHGPAHQVDGMVRFMLMQLASFPAAAATQVILVGNVDRLPLSARFLPGITLATSNESALDALQRLKGIPHGRLIILNDSLGAPDSTGHLRETALAASWQVMQHCGHTAADSELGVEIGQSGTSAALVSGGRRQPFIPDMVPEAAFDQFCRRVAAGSYIADIADAGIPAECSLGELLHCGPRGILRQWADESRRKELKAVLGKGIDGPLSFDFLLDGPHLLVAGTTGSGKSELLRTIVASVALNHSPDQVTFLFVDFKGGSGLRPLVGLPHCVGLLTDLGSHHLERALTSLRGEIRHREEVFAAAGVSDLATYQRATAATERAIPHLVLVIDEFRMLVDEAPGALRELMRIAAIGRSLGIHLVMATQRPQGALTADIRANVTSSIALRVQSEAESADIINSKAAASIRVDVPGRAYLVRASNPPEEFQTASLAVPGPTGPMQRNMSIAQSPQSAVVQSATQALHHTPGSQPSIDTTTALMGAMVEKMVSAVQVAWDCLGGKSPRLPVASPLPTSIGWTDELAAVREAGSAGRAGAAMPEDPAGLVGPLGLVDRPEQQTVEAIHWSPSDHGHLAMIGTSSSGMPECFKATAALLAAHGTEPHLYILDATGMLGRFAESRNYGAVVGLHQLPLAVQVLKRLSEEMARRRQAGTYRHSSSRLVLIVAGWCSWAAALRAGSLAWGEDVLKEIVRDGNSLGVTVLVSGERELVSSRFFAAIPNRAYFPTGSTEESRFHWPRFPEVEPMPGRGVAVGNFVQGTTSVAQFRNAPENLAWPYDVVQPSSEPPFRVRPLPDVLSQQDFDLALATIPRNSQASLLYAKTNTNDMGTDQSCGDAVKTSPLWIGVGGDEAVPVQLPLRPSGVSLVLGGHRSGKSSVLGSLKALNPQVPWIYPAQGSPPGPFWENVARSETAGTLDPTSILLVDDADSLDAAGRKALIVLAGHTRGIVMTATTGPTLLQRLPLAAEVQASGTGLVLSPRTPLDGDILGVRLDVDASAGPGRGVIVQGNHAEPFQAAFTTDSPARAAA